MEWYFAKHGSQNGPLPVESLRAMLAAGELLGSDMVWREGMSEWKPASSVPELMQESTSPGSPMGMPAAPLGSYPVAKRVSGMAVASLVCGVIGLSGFFACMVPCVVAFGAVICGHLALRDIRRRPDMLEGKGVALAGLISGYFTIFVLVIIVGIMGWAVSLPTESKDLQENPTELEEVQPAPPSEGMEAYD